MTVLKKGVTSLAVLPLVLSITWAVFFLGVSGRSASGAVDANSSDAKNVDDPQTRGTNTLSTGLTANSRSTTNVGADRLSLLPRERALSGGLFGAATTTGETERTFLMLPGGLAYEGDVRDGQPNGQGTMTSPYGTHQWGEFRNGLSYKLTGTWVGADGTREEGTWNLDGTRCGGTIMWQDGRVYKGDWKLVNGAPEQADGNGTMTWPDGRVYVGQFRDGKMDGPGKMTHPSGRVEEGLWKQDQFVGPSP